MKDDMKDIIRETVREVLREYERPEEGHKYYFQKTERYLNMLPALERSLARRKQELLDIKREGPEDRSVSLLIDQVRSKGYKPSAVEMQLLRQHKRISQFKEKIKRMQARSIEIRDALDKISRKEGYDAIVLYYLQGIGIEDILETMHISKSTFYRWREKLVGELAVILFGADAME